MKRLTVIVVALMASMALAACSSAGETQPDVSSVPESTSTPVESAAPSEAAEEPSKSSEEAEPGETATVGEGALGDYYVKLTGVTVAEDYEGNPALIVNYDFTNNSDEAANAMWSLNIDVFQNGLELETAVIADSSVYDSGQSMRDIQTGATLSCQDAFVLEDTTSPVEIHVSELISFDDTEVTATYNLK